MGRLPPLSLQFPDLFSVEESNLGYQIQNLRCCSYTNRDTANLGGSRHSQVETLDLQTAYSAHS